MREKKKQSKGVGKSGLCKWANNGTGGFHTKLP